MLKPRLKISTMATSLPAEYLAQIQELLREQRPEYIWVVEGLIYSDEVTLRLGFREPERLKQNNLELSMDLNQKDPLMAQISFGFEYLHFILEEVFSQALASGDEFFDPFQELPVLWKKILFQKKQLYFKTSGENTDLEAEADRLLGLRSAAENDHLVKEFRSEQELQDALDQVLDDEFATADVTDDLPADSRSNMEKGNAVPADPLIH